MQNKARKSNFQVVAEEEKKKNDPEHLEAQQRRQEYEAEQERQKQDLISRGLDPAKEKVMTTTAGDAEWKYSSDKKKDKAKSKGFGWKRKYILYDSHDYAT